jgi:anti-sigma B factor antagonist
MALDISPRKAGDITILDLKGRATLGKDSDKLNEALRDQIATGVRKLLVNLSGLNQMDSSGIATLVRSYVTMGVAGGSLKLLSSGGRVHDVLLVTHLLKAIPHFDNEAQAIASFS